MIPLPVLTAAAGLLTGMPQCAVAGRWLGAATLAPAMGPPKALRAVPAAVTFGLATGALLALLALRTHSPAQLAAGGWFVTCAVPLAWIDIRTRRLPDFLTVSAWAGLIVILGASAAAAGDWSSLAHAVAGGAALTAFYLTLLLVAPSSIGAGDVKAAASAGTVMGWSGWLTLAGGTFASLAAAGIYGAWLLLSRRAFAGASIAFGPFLFAGCIFAVLGWPPVGR